MTRFSLIRCLLTVMVLAVTGMLTLSVVLENRVAHTPRVLFIKGGSDEYWQRALVGARAAGREFGVDLHVEETPLSNTVQDQNTILHNVTNAAYEGVVFSPTDPDRQCDIVNKLADRTKVVTLGKDCRELKRLCHVGFRQADAGRLAARLVRGELPKHGKVALLTSVLLDVGLNTHVGDRLVGFKEEWKEQGMFATCGIVDVAIDSADLQQMAQRLSAMLADPDVRYIVAFDSNAAEAALRALAAAPPAQRKPITAFDPSAAILAAIESGRDCSAIYQDPYRDGYEAIRRLARYCRGDSWVLPVPGHGDFPISGEVLRKENMVEVLNRTGSLPDGCVIAAPQRTVAFR